jgi:serine-type D-Ala-D-Ala carboxypeptidase/endopeptidase (penicillin-binding protein 4)
MGGTCPGVRCRCNASRKISGGCETQQLHNHVVNLWRHVALTALAVCVAASAHAKPPQRKPLDPKKLGAAARVNYGRELRPPRETTGRRTDKATLEEDAAAAIQKLLRGPTLRNGVTGLYVVDAKTGEPLFAVNATDPLNPASNVKMISTATALELLGPAFRYPTRVMGPEPVAGVIKGDVYLLGSHDPMLTLAHFDQLATSLVTRGVTKIEGSVVTGSDPTRDGIFRAIVPIEIHPGEPGGAAKVVVPKGFDFVTIKNTATTARRDMRARLTYKVETTTTATGEPRIELSIGGTMGKSGKVDYPLAATTARTATAASALIGALRARSITVGGGWKTAELGDFVGISVARGALPVELGRHDSIPITEIVSIVNKWSVNWLADRLVMTAAGLSKGQPPTMDLAVAAMYRWLDRHPHVPKKSVVLDTGSGLSYQTQISATDLVSVVRSAAGFAKGSDPALAKVWTTSLAVAGIDGTLRYRFRATDTRGGRIVAKTGTLSTVIALSGIVDLDPQRPLAFALVTNTDTPLSKPVVRKAHEQVISEICKYIARTSRTPIKVPAAPQPAAPTMPDDRDDEPDSQLDREAAGQR